MSSFGTLTVLNLNFFPVLTIYGSVDDTYRVDSAEDLNSSNWTPMTYITLPSTEYHVVDTNSPGGIHKFYRAVYQP